MHELDCGSIYGTPAYLTSLENPQIKLIHSKHCQNIRVDTIVQHSKSDGLLFLHFAEQHQASVEMESEGQFRIR